MVVVQKSSHSPARVRVCKNGVHRNGGWDGAGNFGHRVAFSCVVCLADEGSDSAEDE